MSGNLLRTKAYSNEDEALLLGKLPEKTDKI